MLSLREEQRIARQRLAIVEDNGGKTAVVVFDARDRAKPYVDAVPFQAASIAPIEQRSVRARDDVAAPGGETERQIRGIRSATERGEPAVAHLPAVAVGAMENAAAVAIVEAGHERQIIDDA